MDIEQTARNMGWRPQEEYKGNPEKWVSAEEFVERGEHVMPILRENNKRLQKELENTKGQINTLKQAFEESQESIKALKQHYDESTARAVEAAKRSLRDELRTARESGDTEAEFAIMDKLDELRDTERKAKETPKAKEAPKKKNDSQPNADPEVTAWYEEREWFGVDKKRTKAITRIAEDLREDGNDMVGVEFLDECERILLEQEGEKEEEPERRPRSKVEGTPTRGNSRSVQAKSFASLPREAQQACLEDAERLVGKNKAFKTLDEWKAEYAKTYYET